MNNKTPIRDKLYQYMLSKFGEQYASGVMFSSSQRQSRESTHSLHSTPHSQQTHPLSESSLNSSGLSFNNLSTPSNKAESGRGSKKTVSVKKLMGKVRDPQQCPICLDGLKNKCILPCRHEYCKECLMGWLDNSNRCPYCREQCNYYVNQGEYCRIEPKVYVPSDIGSVGSSLDYQCYLCDQTLEGDVVIICDLCMINAVHPRCQPLLRGRMPHESQEWICHYCRE